MDFQHVKPGKGSAFVRVKLRNLRTGALVENTYNTNITVERARVDRLPMAYLYANGTDHVFMNNETYDQMEIPEDKYDEDDYIEVEFDYKDNKKGNSIITKNRILFIIKSINQL